MAQRDIEKNVATDYFVETLRRLATALEQGEPFRIQVANQRFVVPGGADLVIEHEVSDGQEELSLELQWTRTAGAAE
jgi:amphi-Trp domain-containing protein